METTTVEECLRLASATLANGDEEKSKAYSLLGILGAVSRLMVSAEAASVNSEGIEVAVRVAMAAESFFTQPTDAAFSEVSEALNQWQNFRGGLHSE